MSRDDDTLLPENSGRDQAGRWQKGQSGNPEGKPVGTRHRATRAIEALLDNEAEKLGRKAVEMALDNDPAALRLCLERLCPPRRERPVDFLLPQLRTSGDAAQAVAALVAGVATGDLTTREAKELGGLIEAFVKTLEVRELSDRITALEEELGTRQQK